MDPQRSVPILQLIVAVLGIPAAAVGSYTAYQNYFTIEAVCQRLRTSIVATMERNLAPDAKHALLRGEVGEFDKKCGDSDPDARTVFAAALQEHRPARPTARTAGADPKTQAAAPAQHRQHLPVFGANSGGHQGWVALARREAGIWAVNFDGYAISEASLPPSGTVLTAQRKLPVWSEIQAATNDPSKLRSMLPAQACVRVLAARPGTGRLWAEVLPALCSGWVALSRRQGDAWVNNFDGYAISETSLPPPGTVLTAQRQLAVWSEPQLARSNDQSKWQSTLPARACVRVVSTRPGTGRLWAEVAPAACS